MPETYLKANLQSDKEGKPYYHLMRVPIVSPDDTLVPAKDLKTLREMAEKAWACEDLVEACKDLYCLYMGPSGGLDTDIPEHFSEQARQVLTNVRAALAKVALTKAAGKEDKT